MPHSQRAFIGHFTKCRAVRWLLDKARPAGPTGAFYAEIFKVARVTSPAMILPDGGVVQGIDHRGDNKITAGRDVREARVGTLPAIAGVGHAIQASGGPPPG